MSLPLVVAPAQLHTHLQQIEQAGQTLSDAGLCLVDLRSPETYAAGHIAGAVNVNPALLNRSAPPTGGLLPEPAAVNEFLQLAGARMGDQIIACDGGLETPAARLVWVLDAYGYEAGGWLDGGYKGWIAAALPTTTEATTATKATDADKGSLELNLVGDNVISVDGLLAELDNPSIKILDVRSADEYNGVDVRAGFGGHVPNASHALWTSMLDTHGQLLDDDTLANMMTNLGISKQDTVVVYCQSHQRSAVTYVALKHLGYNDVLAIDGAWSAWGNRADTPKA